MASAIENMQRALATYRERNLVYGNNYKQFGEWMVKLFPNGLTLETVHDWNRMGVLLQICSKLSRYAQNPTQGHIDTIHDLGVYAFMLEELDSMYCIICGALLTGGKCLACVLENDLPLAAAAPTKLDNANPCEHVWPEGELYCLNCGHSRPDTPSCICGYDARNNERDSNSDCRVHFPKPMIPLSEQPVCPSCRAIGTHICLMGGSH